MKSARSRLRYYERALTWHNAHKSDRADQQPYGNTSQAPWMLTTAMFCIGL
jgi:hypothetical protein